MTLPPGDLLRQDVPGGIRTPNLLIRSQLLYPVELQTHFVAVTHSTSAPMADKLSPNSSPSRSLLCAKPSLAKNIKKILPRGGDFRLNPQREIPRLPKTGFRNQSRAHSRAASRSRDAPAPSRPARPDC